VPYLASLLLQDAWRERASDIHLDPQSGGYRICFRIDGVLYVAALLTREQAHRLVNQFKTWAKLDPVHTFTCQESRWTYSIDDQLLHLRLTGVPCVNGEKLTIRLLNPKRVEHRLDELGLSESHFEHIQAWLNNIKGMFLVVGPTGSGKTTTLYGLLHELIAHGKSIVTIEEPVEYQIDGISQIQVDRRHDLTFAQGLRTMLRLDPDYLMVGEIRDAESARSATDASVGGRILLSTLHSPDSVGTITTLRNWGLKDYEIAANVSVIVAQRLVRVLCGHCKEKRALSKTQQAWLASIVGNGSKIDQAWFVVGCDRCGQTGYVGRTGIFEVWRLNEEDYESILAGQDEHALREQLLKRNQPLLLADAIEKFKEGITSLESLQAIAGLPGVEFKSL